MPRAYLRAWAAGEFVGMGLCGSAVLATPNISKAGVIKDFYRRFLPDGSPTDDVEESLAKLESVTIPLLRGLRQIWPLDTNGKGVVGQYLALQMVRGVGWRQFRAGVLADSHPTLRADIHERFRGDGWVLPDGTSGRDPSGRAPTCR